MSFDTIPLKRVARIRNSNVDKLISDDEIPVRLCNYVDVYYNDSLTPALNLSVGSATKIEIERFHLKEGDVVITKDSETPSDIAIPAIVRKSGPKLVCGYHLAILKAAPDKLEGVYLFYALKSKPLAAYFETSAQGITRYGLTINGIGMAPIPIPPLSTQRTIAEFLDRETARIDQLIEKKQRLVELIKERQSATIMKMVQGGETLRDKRPDRWLSYMPSDWNAFKLNQLVSIKGGATPSKDREDYWVGSIPWFSPKDLKRPILSDSVDHVSDSALSNSSLSLIEPNAVLIVTRGMILGRYVPVGLTTIRSTINQDMKAFLPNKRVTPRYLLWMLFGLNEVLSGLVEEAAHGTKKIETPRLMRLKFPIPPIQEQERLEKKITELLNATELAMEKSNTSISRLREFRSALITAAVTGQIDVDEWSRRGGTDAKLDAIAQKMEARA